MGATRGAAVPSPTPSTVGEPRSRPARKPSVGSERQDGLEIVWFRRDLRLHDHPALTAAASAPRLLCVFVFDDRLLHGRHGSRVRTGFLLEALAELRWSLAERGQKLVLRRGRPEVELRSLALATGATRVHATADVGPYARAREAAVRAALAEIAVELRLHPGCFACDDPAAVAGTTIFTPYYRRWLAAPRREPLAVPTLPPPPPPPPPLDAGELPSVDDLAPPGADAPARPRGGERAGRERMTRFLAGPVREYARLHDLPARAATSRLSPYLHFGCVSARELEARLGRSEGEQAFRRQLAWRDFYAALLRRDPLLARRELRVEYRALRWQRDERALRAWRDGLTGYPLVDAAMRQLRHEGWVHNRARLVAGSFLTKHLGVDWREGERWYMRMLVDGDEASNNGNWQWIASVGSDPAPPARRILNPTLQAERFDPDGEYIARYVPELANVPARYRRQPWLMPEALQRECGCVIGRDYPPPIVDHRAARERALARYRAARAAAPACGRR